MIGVKFGNIHSYNDLGMKMLAESTIGNPEPYINELEIPGKDGVIDYSESLTGNITYKQREISLMFTLAGSDETDYLKKYDKVKNSLHGKRIKIIPDFDKEFEYDARITIEEEKVSDMFAVLTVAGTAFPYKRKTSDTVVTKTLSSSEAVITCNNLREPVIPKFETTASAKIKFDNHEFSVGAGSHVLDLVFTEGENMVKASGTGTLKIIYREGGM